MPETRAKILNGQSLSGEIDLRGYRLTAIQYPSAWTAADLSVQAASKPGGSFGEVFVDTGNGTGAALAIDAAASQVTFLNNEVFVGDCVIKLRSGPVGVPVNQGADRDITLILSTLAV